MSQLTASQIHEINASSPFPAELTDENVAVVLQTIAGKRLGQSAWFKIADQTSISVGNARRFVEAEKEARAAQRVDTRSAEDRRIDRILTTVDSNGRRTARRLS